MLDPRRTTGVLHDKNIVSNCDLLLLVGMATPPHE